MLQIPSLPLSAERRIGMRCRPTRLSRSGKLLERCLENDRNKRLPDIAVAQFLLTERVPTKPALSRVESRRHVGLAAMISIAAAVILTATALGIIARWNTAKAPQTVRFTFVPPAGA